MHNIFFATFRLSEGDLKGKRTEELRIEYSGLSSSIWEPQLCCTASYWALSVGSKILIMPGYYKNCSFRSIRYYFHFTSFKLSTVKVKITQLFPTLCDPMVFPFSLNLTFTASATSPQLILNKLPYFVINSLSLITSNYLFPVHSYYWVVTFPQNSVNAHFSSIKKRRGGVFSVPCLF